MIADQFMYYFSFSGNSSTTHFSRIVDTKSFSHYQVHFKDLYW